MELTKIKTSVSDRSLFKTCKQKWDWSSRLRQNLEPIEGINANLWFGNGIHFALEDYHSYNRFGNPIEAFEAYYKCFNRETELNMDCEVYATMAPGILNFYLEEWLPTRKQFKTYWHNHIPQVEVRVVLELKQLSKLLGKPVFYSMVFDRVVEDDEGRLWVMDYKTAASFDTTKLETDPQISTYAWGAELYYGRPIEGMVYLQFKKTLIEDPRILKNGDLSTDKSQNTNYYRYLQMLNFKFGNPESAPDKYRDCLNNLLMEESEYGDKYIRYDFVRRNDYQRKNEYKLIRDEILDMVDPNLRIYPTFTKDCKKNCNFRNACIAKYDGSDYQFILDNNFQKATGERDKWKENLIYPDVNKNSTKEGE